MPLRLIFRLPRRTTFLLPVPSCIDGICGAPSYTLRTQGIRAFSISSTSIKFNAFNKWDASTRHELYRRRQTVGPEPLRHRNIWQNWDYDAEIYTFSARLGEKFSAESLRLAFMHPSYVEQEAAKRREAMIFDNVELDSVSDQTQLKRVGMEIMESYVPAFIRLNFPYFPEEGVRSITQYLCSENVLATVSFHLGTSDLIMCADLPPQRKTLSDTLLAVIGALAKDSGSESAEHFVLDFIVTEMVDKDVNDFLTLKLSNPMGVLVDILKRGGHAEPESRLLRRTGSTTLVAAYVVGLYSDKKLVGESFGESLMIAEEMAARDALRRLFRTDHSQRPWIFGDAGKRLDLSGFYNQPNVSLKEWSQTACEKTMQQRVTASINVPKKNAALQ